MTIQKLADDIQALIESTSSNNLSERKAQIINQLELIREKADKVHSLVTTIKANSQILI